MAVSKREPTLRAELVRKALSQRGGILSQGDPSFYHQPKPEQLPLPPNRCPAKAEDYFLADFKDTLWLRVDRLSSQPEQLNHLGWTLSTLSHSLPARGTLPT